SGRRVLEIEHSQYANHNGGQLQFGPDGYLYISTGDGGGAGDPLRNGQDKRSLLGKLLRIDPRRAGPGRPYSAPRDNPFVGRAGRREIYAYGLRNPFRFSFDRNTGDLAIGDVGESAREEVDFRLKGQPGGANFGWSCYEGSLVYEGRGAGCLNGGPHVRPVLEYSHSGGRCSITGGYVARHRSLKALRGRYVYGDFCTGQLRSARLSLSGATGDRGLGLGVGEYDLSSFGQDTRGRLYVLRLDGAVFRLLG
ncbi:MAG TPA: PQQ-dependent sugar dehydrogenase, partial [Thermoleophilaceae bacterium]|nr:PQQ-dependent sugar dehydrogenase [Thermoleophilaceae bacterium]